MSVVKHLELNFDEKSPRTEVVYNHEHARVIRFYLKDGQEIKPHKSPSSVFITVLKGELNFYMGKEDKEEILRAGDTVFYEPEELHGFKAIEDSVVEAIIVPNPSMGRINIK